VRLQIAPLAAADMEGVALYITAENPRAAQAVVDAIERRLRQLLQHPHAGLLREDIGPGIRRVVIGQYLAFYRVTPDAVHVLRVLHGKRRITGETVTESADEK